MRRISEDIYMQQRKPFRQSVAGGLFEIEKEATIPEGDSYHCDEYESRKAWVEDRLPFCEDLDALMEVSEKIKKVVKGQKHKVLEYWKEYQVLLRKIG